MSSAAVSPLPEPAPVIGWRDYAAWCRRHPLETALFVVLSLATIYFFAIYKVFHDGHASALGWAMSAWNAENDLEHGGIIMPIAFGIAWYHRQRLWLAPKSTCWWGLAIALLGAFIYVLSVRTLQGRLAQIALPFLFYGSVRFLWGRETARVILFPCVFLLFMIPAGFLVSRTVGLQTLAAVTAAKLSGLIGIGVTANGTELRALDGSFQFEVAGGCSGIRSLTAMTMLAALFVHFTQKELWKKIVIFCGSLVFALIGNLVRIFSVVLFARFIDVKMATGLYHDYSGFIFFPIAVFCMLSVSNLLNRDYSHWWQAEEKTTTSTLPETTPSTTPGKSKTPSAVSYDY